MEIALAQTPGIDLGQNNINEPTVNGRSLLSMGNTVVHAHGFPLDNRQVVVIHNYTSAVVSKDNSHLIPYHVAPNPSTDWYLNYAALSSAHEGETILLLTLQPGILDYYRETGIISDKVKVIEVNPDLDSGRLGYPFTDPLTQMLQQGLRFEDSPFIVASFPSNLALSQAKKLGAIPIQLSDPRETSNKADFRDAAKEYKYSVLPGVQISSEKDIQDATELFSNSSRVWMKLAHGGGGDTVLPINGPITHKKLLESITTLRTTVHQAFKEADFGLGAEEKFWPSDSLLPIHSRIVIEKDAYELGKVLINGSSILTTHQSGDVEISGHSIQRTGPNGDYRGTMPYTPPTEVEALIASEMNKIGTYCIEKLNLYGVIGVDWMLINSPEGELNLYSLELNGRPSSSSMAMATANKLGVTEYININLNSDTPINNIAEFENKVTVNGLNFARSDLENGRVIPLTLNSQYIRDTSGELSLITSSNQVKVLIASSSGLEQCNKILELLKINGLSEDPIL